ncbi:MAG: tRNA pseudouridine(13) synthase TruD [Planctomycetota bacterium]
MSAPTLDDGRVIAFEFKEAPEDFEVEELDAPPDRDDAEATNAAPATGAIDSAHAQSGGDHLTLRVRAVGLGTQEVARRLTRALGLGPRAASFAGRKDVQAVITQRLAFEHGDPARLDTAEARESLGDRIEVLEVAWRRSALRAGESLGNRFGITLRGVAAADAPLLTQRLARIAARGLPNAFGAQRFGRDGRTAELGRLLVQGDPLAYLDGLAATSDERHREAALELARRAREGTPGEKRKATELCRGLDRTLAEVARQLARRRDDPDSLVRVVPKEQRGFHLSALQSRIFDRVLAARVTAGTFDVPHEGDVLLRPGRGPFVLRHRADVGVVAAASAWQLEVSGPMWSPRMVLAEGATFAAELAALAAEGLAPEALERPGGLAPKGARRALRARVGEARVEPLGGDGALRLVCTLPAGAYATTLLDALRG